MRESDELIGLRVDVRRIDESAGEAESAVLHSLLDENLHLAELGGCGSAIVVANYSFANLGGADIGADVQRCALLFEPAEIAVESGPINCKFVMVEKRLLRRDGLFILRGDGAAFAGDFRGNALRELAQRTIVEEERDFGLAEHVNEARSDDAAFRIDFSFSMGFAQIANCGEAIATYSDIGGIPGIPGAVDDVTIADDEIIVAGNCPGNQVCVISSRGNLSEGLASHLLRGFRSTSERVEFDCEIRVSKFGPVDDLPDALRQSEFRLCTGRRGLEAQKEHGAQRTTQRQNARTVFQSRILQKMMPHGQASSQALYQRNPLRCSSAISFARASVCARRYWPTAARMAFNKAMGAV